MATYQTIQKKELLRFLQRNSQRAYTIDEIVSAMDADPSCTGSPGKSTIYRLLPSLVEAGTVHRFSRENGRKASYQIVGGQDCHGHIHMKCTCCGRLLHMSDEASCSLAEEISRSQNFSVDLAHTLLYGTCASCQEGGRRESHHE